MEVIGLLIKQIITMVLYMAVGFALFKGKKITKEGSSNIATLLIWLIIPTVLIKSYCVEPTAQRMQDLAISAAAAALCLAVSILIGRLVYKKYPIENFSVAFSNAGFFGLPLVSAVFGADAVFYITTFVALLNVLQWAYGVAVLKEEKLKPSKSMILNPLAISFLVGLFLFFTGLGAKLPAIVMNTMGGITAMNAPLAMLVMGVYLAQADMKTLWNDRRLYFISLVRLALIPLVTLLLLWLLPIDKTMALCLLLTASAPVGANVAVYAQLVGKDYVYGTKAVVTSTLLSLVSMPLVLMLAQWLLGLKG